MTLTHVMMDSRKTKMSAHCLVQDLVFGIMIWMPFVSVCIPFESVHVISNNVVF